MAGDRDVERSIHRQFAEYRVDGEWFRAEPEVLDFVEQNFEIPT